MEEAIDWREDAWAFSLRNPQDRGGYTVYKFQLAEKWSESEKISCHAFLKNLYEPKMDVILTISFKVTAEIEIRKPQAAQT